MNGLTVLYHVDEPWGHAPVLKMGRVMRETPKFYFLDVAIQGFSKRVEKARMDHDLIRSTPEQAWSAYLTRLHDNSKRLQEQITRNAHNASVAQQELDNLRRKS